MKNIHTTLPPQYRDLWKTQFAEVKAKDVAEHREWLYEADPFATQQRLDEDRRLKEKKRAEQAKQRAKEAATPVAQLASLGQNLSFESRNLLRGWTRVPKAELGKQRRAEIEDLLRRQSLWTAPNQERPKAHVETVVDELSRLGFRRSHAMEAMEDCKDRDEAIEWLLIYVPEDDLPKWCLPEGYAPGISLASGDLKRQASIQRISSAGYSADFCEKTLQSAHGNEIAAARFLQENLMGRNSDFALNKEQDFNSSNHESLAPNPCWQEECRSLEAIYGDRLTTASNQDVEIGFEILGNPRSLKVRLGITADYPRVVPLVSIISVALPAHIKLSLTRSVVTSAEADFLGEAMVFNIVDWLESHAQHVIDNPGRLKELITVSSNMPPPKFTMPSRIRHDNKHSLYHPNDQASRDILQRWRGKQTRPDVLNMLDGRKALPAWKMRDIIIATVNNHQVTIISGETGSGKSTQSVQFILDDLIQRALGSSANMYCTQPRRISALGLADRVSAERCSAVGDEVGYAIRGESKRKPGQTRITFVTTGVLLRRLQTNGSSQKDMVTALADISHIVIDEIHERSLDADLLLALLKDLLHRLPDLKVILMSATLDASIFESYFAPKSVGRVEIEGRTYPVEDVYIDDILRNTGYGDDDLKVDEWDSDRAVGKTLQNLGMGINYDLITETVQMIDGELGTANAGGILIFLPGMAEIDRTLKALQKLPKIHALPLHASLLPAEQRRVFPRAPQGLRKVIAATNVAETSITIEDIVAVIDLGRVKETKFDPVTRMVKLEEVWASQAACKQRRGRAGRVQAGKCYKLFTRNAEAKMAERPEPEIRRVPLEQLCLTTKAMGIQDVTGFLAGTLTPPKSLAIDAALTLLRRMGAFDGNDITALGRNLAMLPADLRCGKLMVYGLTFGCFEVCLTMAAILTVRSPFVSPQSKRDESKASRASFGNNQGDLLCDARAYEIWTEKKEQMRYRDLRQWCDDNYLSVQTLNDIHSNRVQYLSALKDTAFLPWGYRADTQSPLNAHNANDPLIRALIAGAFSPQITRIDFPDKKFANSVSGAVEVDPEARTIKFFDEHSGRVFVHPSSTLFGAQGFVSGTAYLSFFSKMETSKIFIRELTPLNVFSLLMFSGPITLDTQGRGLLVDGWIKIRGWARIGVLVSRLRKMLDQALAEKIENPGLDISGQEVVNIVRRLVELDGMDR